MPFITQPSLSRDEAVALACKIEAINADPGFIRDIKDDALRRRLRDAGRSLGFAMETMVETIGRIGTAPMQLAMARIGQEAGIFAALAEADGRVLSHSDVAQKTVMDPILLNQFLRWYQSYDYISNPDVDGYAANDITRALASSAGYDGIHLYSEFKAPVFAAFPQFMRENGFQAPTDPARCGFQLGQRTSLSAFAWLLQRPEHQGHFIRWMTGRMAGLALWLDGFDFPGVVLGAGKQGAAGAAAETDADTVLFVDVGGALGHNAILLRQRYPDLKGRVVVQDQASVVEQSRAAALPGHEDVERQVYDFWTPQPIKGARAYYFSHIFHDWPDHKCLEILANTMSAMTAGSVLLIDEAVVPERRAPWLTTDLDLCMVTALAARERTRADWEALLARAGFEVLGIHKYQEDFEQAVIVAAPLDLAP